jgi:hypothetical protein
MNSQDDRQPAGEVEFLTTKEDTYARAKRQALASKEEGFHLGGAIRVTRDELHER